MIHAADVREWRNRDVVDAESHKIGVLEAIYVDTTTDEPAMATVRTGLPTRHGRGHGGGRSRGGGSDLGDYRGPRDYQDYRERRDRQDRWDRRYTRQNRARRRREDRREHEHHR